MRLRTVNECRSRFVAKLRRGIAAIMAAMAVAKERSSILAPTMRDWMQTRRWAAPWVLAAVVIGAMTTGARPSRAADASDTEKAEQLIREGNALRRNNQDARALPMFQQAYAISRTPRSAAQLALAELALGYWDAAAEHLTEALTAGRHPWVAKNRSALEASLNEAKSHLASVSVTGRPVGAEVLLNGKSVGTLPLGGPVLVNEGRIETEVRASGYKTDHRVLTVEGSSTAQVSVNLESVPAATAHQEAPTSSAPATSAPVAGDSGTPVAPPAKDRDAASSGGQLPTWRKVLPWAVTAGAVAAGGIGVWQAVSASKSLSDFEAVPNMACGASEPMRGTDSRCAGLYNDWSSHRTNAWVAFGAAGVLAAGAVGLFIWNAYDTPVDVQVGASSAQISLHGTF